MASSNPLLEAQTAWMLAEGRVDTDTATEWRRTLEYANPAGTFYMGMTMVVALARKP